MKKTLLAMAVLALCGMATAAPVDLPITTDLTTTTNITNLAGFGGFDFYVGSDSAFSAAQEIDYTKVEDITLNSITLSVYGTWYTLRHSDVGFGTAIFQKVEKNNVTSWTLVGKTDWWKATSEAYTGSVTLTPANDIKLELGQTYTIAFFAGEDYFDGLVIGATRDSMLGAGEWKDATVPSDTNGLAAVGLRGVKAAGNGITLYTGRGTATDMTPNVGLNVTITPEPATATLSLLALAGMASRRRRK